MRLKKNLEEGNTNEILLIFLYTIAGAQQQEQKTEPDTIIGSREKN